MREEEQDPQLRRGNWEGTGGVSYLREVIPSRQDTIGGPLQDLPHTIVEAQRGPVQRAVYLTPVEPRSAERGRGWAIKTESRADREHTAQGDQRWQKYPYYVPE